MPENISVGSLADLVVSFIFLYLAAYAITGVAGLLRLRIKEQGMKGGPAINLSIKYICEMVGYLLLVAHAVWDKFVPQHFPTRITYPVLSIILLLAGRSTYQLIGSRGLWMK